MLAVAFLNMQLYISTWNVIYYFKQQNRIPYVLIVLCKLYCRDYIDNLYFGSIVHVILSFSLQWRHNGHDCISNHQPHDCLLNRLFRRRSKQISKLGVTGLCAGHSLVTGEFPAQMASNAENVFLWWHHHVRESFQQQSSVVEKIRKLLHTAISATSSQKVHCLEIHE